MRLSLEGEHHCSLGLLLSFEDNARGIRRVEKGNVKPLIKVKGREMEKSP